MVETQSDSESMNFTPREWQYFVQELSDMLAEDKFDVTQAVNNARYLAILDKSFKQIEREGVVTFTDEEWDKFTRISEKASHPNRRVVVPDGYDIQLDWDDEEKVWIATSDDIPGLILEDESADKLIQRVMLAAPEIIELNGVEKRQDFYFHCDRHEKLKNI